MPAVQIKAFSYSSGKSFICFEKVFPSLPLLFTAQMAMECKTGRKALPDFDSS